MQYHANSFFCFLFGLNIELSIFTLKDLRTLNIFSNTYQIENTQFFGTPPSSD